MDREERRKRELEERKRELEEKKKELKTLKNEIAELEGKKIKSYSTNKLIHSVCCDEDTEEITVVFTDRAIHPSWDYIRKLSTNMFLWVKSSTSSGEHYMTYGNVKQKDLNPDQLKLCGAFCDEVIDLCNKYTKLANPTMKFFGKERNPWEESSGKE